MHREPEVAEAEAQVGNWIRQKKDSYLGKIALMRIAKLTNSPARSLKRMVTKLAVAFFEEYTTIGLRFSKYGAAEVYNDFAEELKHTEANPMCSIH